MQVVLVGGTSGTCDWRDGEEAVRPGDLVLPWTYLSLDAVPSGLPGTELENVLAERVALMDEPFCPSLSREIIREVGTLDSARFRRVHDQDARVVLHRWQYGAGFESAGYSLFLREYGRSVGHPVITGDCVSPVLARVCGMHLGYYHFPSNWAEGLRPQNLTSTLDALYLRDAARGRRHARAPASRASRHADGLPLSPAPAAAARRVPSRAQSTPTPDRRA